MPADFRKVLQRLRARLGPQHWLPARSAFEVCVGAVLTQNTAWTNVERAIRNLRDARALDPARLHNLPRRRLAQLLRPTGYFNVKTRRLKAFLKSFHERFCASIRRMKRVETDTLRVWLLEISGIGRETADSILLYALQKSIFVVDAYTRRIFARHGWIRGDEDYDQIRVLVETAWQRQPAAVRVRDYNELHALLVAVGKDFCRPRAPRCENCPLASMLPRSGPSGILSDRHS